MKNQDTKRFPGYAGPGYGSQGGFSLLEILVAFAVLGIGMIGILALFPIASQRVNQTVSGSQASAIAESLHQAFVVGFHNMEGDQVYVRHAGLGQNCGGDQKECYKFTRPSSPGSGVRTDEHPRKTNNGTAASPHQELFWQFRPEGQETQDEPLSKLIEDVKTTDESMDLNQYRMSVKVERFSQQSLFRVQIAVYRNYRKIPSAKIETAPSDRSQPVRHPDLVKEYRAMIAGGG